MKANELRKGVAIDNGKIVHASSAVNGRLWRLAFTDGTLCVCPPEMEFATVTTVNTFVEKTSLLVAVLVGAVLAEKSHALTRTQTAWFTDHCDRRFRYFHANNPTWQKWLEDRDQNIDPRDQCKVWIRHWLAAYTLDPERFQSREN